MAKQQGRDLFVVANSDTDWKVSAYLTEWPPMPVSTHRRDPNTPTQRQEHAIPFDSRHSAC
jgi:hypothetical protein